MYQRKVLGYEEHSEVFSDALEKILMAKKQARQLAAMLPDKTPLPPLKEEVKREPPTKLDLIDKYARNRDHIGVGEKSYLAQFYIKPNQSVDREYEKIRPVPIDNTNAEYIASPTDGNGYNLDFEPYASKYDNKLMVD